ncbi:MAG: hypothetical protein QM796_14495 [Chthoniobacteraceae bacterium]
MNDGFPNFRSVPNESEHDGTVPNHAELFRSVPNLAEPFRSVPMKTDSFRTIQNESQQNAHHTLTVREAARLFEQAGVPRTERSIVKWCQPNAQGIARLDAYLDTNERRYFITPESVTRAIEEEKSRQSSAQVVPNLSDDTEPIKSNSKRSESASESSDVKLRDLEIATRVKDQYITLLEKQLDEFGLERKMYIEKLINNSRKLGEMEFRLQLTSPSKPDDQNSPEEIVTN